MGKMDTGPLCRLLEFYSEQGRTLDSITHLCGRSRKTLIKYARMNGLSFPDLRRPRTPKANLSQDDLADFGPQGSAMLQNDIFAQI
jgi:hypothetical protein